MKLQVLLAVGICTASLLAANSAQARMTEAQVKASLEKSYPVRVLDKHTREIEFDGKAAYEVKVMNVGGDYNSAFMITTLIVDADSGQLLRVFRHRDSGYELPGGGENDPNRQAPDAASGVLWR